LSYNFHPRPYYGVGFNHLKPLVVIRGVRTGEEGVLSLD
jgi:hypothetical protein